MWTLLILVALSASPTQDSTVKDKTYKDVTVTLSDKGATEDGKRELVFAVTNGTKKKLKLCTYFTPFEGFLGELLEVRHEDGGEAQYLGISVKRGKPGKDDYIQVAPGETREVTFNLAEHYDLSKKGRYTVQFQGNEDMNRLPDSNVLEIEVR
ncbi:MAG: hypothetical protein EP329_00125 [Deltaproteobacteria bacterium]|nr:MAG: hypothetical protein EP329_00125 [Deltaproteobacteria bacterium]